jgi:tetraacyldisaccharide 4'-kinase
VVDPRAVEHLWYGKDPASAFARTLLTPASLVYGGAVGMRDALYDIGWLRTHHAPISVVSVGNLTVGGTGKTPVAAWIARGLAARGARPAIVLRGYGDDEPLVHRSLNRSVPVIVGADRLAAVERAATDGADVAVLDDGFQHRRIARDVDIVLVSADQWTGDVRLLPAGPWREPLHAIRRATLVVVTCKASCDDAVDRVHDRLATVAPMVPRVSVRIVPLDLVNTIDRGETRPLSSLAGVRVGVVVSIGDPTAFMSQVSGLGSRFNAKVDARLFPDHHAFTDREVAEVARDLKHVDMVLCTLKDAVKLAARWPRLGPPLWYVSQDVQVERGVGGLDSVLDGVVRARASRTHRTPSQVAG